MKSTLQLARQDAPDAIDLLYFFILACREVKEHTDTLINLEMTFIREEITDPGLNTRFEDLASWQRCIHSDLKGSCAHHRAQIVVIQVKRIPALQAGRKAVERSAFRSLEEIVIEERLSPYRRDCYLLFSGAEVNSSSRREMKVD